MTLKKTIENMKCLLEAITSDLEKAVNGNKAASQRVRVHTIELEKTAKLYRKESVHAEKTEKPASSSKKTVAKKATAKMPKKKK